MIPMNMQPLPMLSMPHMPFNQHCQVAAAAPAPECEIAAVLDVALSKTPYANGALAIPRTSYNPSTGSVGHVEELLYNIQMLFLENMRITNYISSTHLMLHTGELNNGIVDRLVEYHARSQHLMYGISELGRQLREYMTPARTIDLVDSPFGNCPVGFLRNDEENYLIPIDLTTWPRLEDKYFFGNLPRGTMVYIDGIWH